MVFTPSQKNAADNGGILDMQLLALLSVFTLLVCNAAAGLASRLTGCLAFTATAVLGTLTQITCLNCLDVLHNFTF